MINGLLPRRKKLLTMRYECQNKKDTARKIVLPMDGDVSILQQLYGL